MAEGTNEEAVLAAIIKAHQGYKETEVSCTGELGLHKSFIICDKNPRHKAFIPVGDFGIEHLPSGYQDKYILDTVKAMSFLTCRVSVSRISNGRPDTYPDDITRPYPFAACKGKSCLRTGTGWVCYFITKYRERDNINCQCMECSKPSETHTPKKEWARINIGTASHVVFDDEEAKDTTCHFFYDSQDMDVKTAPSIKGVNITYSDIKKDACVMVCFTHDMALVNQLDEMCTYGSELDNTVLRKYSINTDKVLSLSRKEDEKDDKPDLCIVVSHPHGCNKQVTVGHWTDRHVVGSDGIIEESWYEYNTPTCPGSSGAPVITLVRGKKNLFDDHYHPHSEGRPGNINSSGTDFEYMRR